MSKRKQEIETVIEENTDEIVESEEIAEEQEEGEKQEKRCPHCGSSVVAKGHEYCYKCEDELLKTKIPFIGWISALVGIALSLFCFLIVALLSAPALQTVKGNFAANENNWFKAYEEYADVEEVLTEITDILGDSKVFSPFMKIGCGVEAKIYKAAVQIYNPIDGYNIASKIFVRNADYIQHNSDYKKCLEYYTEVEAINAAFGETFADLQGVEDPTPEMGKNYLEQMEAFRGKEGVSEVWLNYLMFDIATGFGIDTDTQLGYLKATHEAAQKEKKSYVWLYYKDYIDLLMKSGKDDEAIPFIDELMEKDISDYSPVADMVKIYAKKGDLDSAEKLVLDYCDNNLTTDGEQSDSNYCLNIIIEKMKGNYEQALEMAIESSETYSLNPEIFRQKLLIQLIQEDYDAAYETACEVDNVLNTRNYYGDSSEYTDDNLTTVYVAAALYKQYGSGKAANSDALDDILENYGTDDREAYANDIISGNIDLKKTLTEGGCDLV